MYIGPWQEYRLAKIQDEAIQRLRMEWELKLTAQLPAADKQQIQELMDPLVAKLPKLLLATPPTHHDIHRRVHHHRRDPSKSTKTTRSATRGSAVEDTERSERQEEEEEEDDDDEGKPSISNQESHEHETTRASTTTASASTCLSSRSTTARAESQTTTQSKDRKPSSSHKNKTKNKTRSKQKQPERSREPNALQKRRQMFASWIQHADRSDSNTCNSNNNNHSIQCRTSNPLATYSSLHNECALDSSRVSSSNPPSRQAHDESVTRVPSQSSSSCSLPPIRSLQSMDPSQLLLGHAQTSHAASAVSLPPFDRTSYRAPVQREEQEEVGEEEGSAPADGARTRDPEAIDLDASLDEEEVNELLNWTQELAVPP